MDAIVLAGGGSNPADPLYPLTRGAPKALLPIAGKPMVQWVLDAAGASRHVDRVWVVGLGPRDGVSCRKETRWLTDCGSLLGNVSAGIGAALGEAPGAAEGAESRRFLVLSSDIPALTPIALDWVIEAALKTDDEFCYCAIDREAMEGLFPGSGRSYLRFRDAEVCGGDLVVIGESLIAGGAARWARFTEGRKSSLRLAAAVGIDVLALFLLRLLGIDELARKVGTRLGVRGGVIHCPFPEIGMDVDKPFQFEMMERHLSGRAGPTVS